MCTRVKSPYKDNWKNLRRCVAYVQGTIGLVMTVGWKMDVLKVSIDTSFAAHPNMRSQTGMVMMFQCISTNRSSIPGVQLRLS